MELVTNSHPAKMDLLYTVFFIDVCSIFVFPVTYFRILLNEKTNSRQRWIWPWEESKPIQVSKAGFFHFAFLLKSLFSFFMTEKACDTIWNVSVYSRWSNQWGFQPFLWIDSFKFSPIQNSTIYSFSVQVQWEWKLVLFSPHFSPLQLVNIASK